jgi:hypothetical protein
MVTHCYQPLSKVNNFQGFFLRKSTELSEEILFVVVANVAPVLPGKSKFAVIFWKSCHMTSHAFVSRIDITGDFSVVNAEIFR